MSIPSPLSAGRKALRQQLAERYPETITARECWWTVWGWLEAEHVFADLGGILIVDAEDRWPLGRLDDPTLGPRLLAYAAKRGDVGVEYVIHSQADWLFRHLLWTGKWTFDLDEVDNQGMLVTRRVRITGRIEGELVFPTPGIQHAEDFAPEVTHWISATGGVIPVPRAPDGSPAHGQRGERATSG